MEEMEHLDVRMNDDLLVKVQTGEYFKIWLHLPVGDVCGQNALIDLLQVFSLLDETTAWRFLL